MTKHKWIEEFPCAITVCDKDGKILEMNKRSISTFQGDGGKDLIGKSVLDCHPAAARQKLEEMLQTQDMNTYTIEKNGQKKLIYQSPWFENGKYMGFVEISLPIPETMPHFVR